MSRVTIKDVAKKAGVSVTIASFALNDVKGRVSKEHRELVLQCAKELNYTPNVNARNLRTANTNMVMLVYGEDYLYERNASTMQLVAGLVKLASERDKEVVIKMLKENHETGMKEAQAFIRSWNSKRVEGMIFQCSWEDEESHIFYRTMYEAGVNLVNISRNGKAPGYPCVYMDEYAIICDAIRYIHGRGYDEIYYLGKSQESMNIRERGYRDTVALLGIPGRVLHYDSYYRTKQDIWQMIKPLVENRRGRIAIQCWNDVDAVNLLEILQDQNVRVPQEVGVMGFDNIPTAEHSHPKLTTINQPFESMAYLALDYVLDQGKKRKKPKGIVSIEIPGEIIERQSV